MRLTLLAVLTTASLFAAPSGDVRLLDAVKNQDRASVRSLLKLKAPVNTADTDGTTALIYAAHVDDLESVKLLLAAGADVKAANRYQVTALAEAATVGNGEMIELLLKAGADANTVVGQGETPLMTASRTGSARGVVALLAKGANVNAKESYRGETALMWAAAENHADVAKLLMAAGADVNAKSTTFDFNFRKVASGGTQSIYYKGGFTALLFAARQGSVEAAQALLEGGANPDLAEPDYSFTPLLEAVYNDHYDLAATLVEKGANLNGGALYVAVEMRNLDYFGNRPRKPVTGKLDELGFIKMLLAKGADPNGVLKTKLPARQTQGPVAVPPGATPFYRAARSADLELMKVLLEFGADASRAANDHTTPLLAAAAGQGARFSGGDERPEPEFVAAIKLCLDKGADVNAVNDRGDTAMHGAAVRGADQIVQFLASNGAKLDVKSKSGKTPYELAMGIGGVANTGGGIHTSTGELIKKLLGAANERK
jgi:ankyrin repeat protein